VSDPFVHLHVASGYSLRHGASHPHVLVERAADHGMDALALTDRDGAYGAVKFVKACAAAGIRPLLGVDLAVVAPTGPEGGPRRPRRSPARGGAFVEPPDPAARHRVTFLARDARGWAAICRLISATHLAGERGRPVTSPELVARAVDESGGAVFVLLGPQSGLGQALARRRPDLARAELARWREVVEPTDVVVEVVSHRGPGESERAARLLGFAAEAGAPAVLTNAVRYADRPDAPTADVLDAARRLVALDPRHVDRANADGYLKSGKEMAEVAADIARFAGLDETAGRRLLARTRAVAERCALDPRADLGIGRVHFPELDTATADADAVLRARCEAGFARRAMPADAAARRRLDDELGVVRQLGYPAYFLTVADVVDIVRGMGVRCAARGSGAGSLVNYLLGISDVDPMRYDLLMERFLSPLREALPDIDLDVESARRTEVYEAILDRYGGDRCTCVSMMDTYRVRHAIRDVGAALGMPPGEIDAVAKAFPHIRAGQVRAALRDLPELRASGLAGRDGDGGPFDLLFRLVERLDGLPRHVALHPCGVLLSDRTLLDRTPVEASWLGFPMSQFDKDDVEELGLLKLDVLGVRMQSSIAYALDEIRRVDGVEVDIDAVPRDDSETFALIQSTRTLGCFQIESPGQRELVGKFAPETFGDIIIDISLFRPGPVKSDMVTPFLEARQGWRPASYLHDDLRPFLAETGGVVVFHEQVLQIIATLTGCSLAEADEVRRALGDPDGQPEAQAWFIPTALAHGYDGATVERAWEVLRAFASFGFCKAHAAAFAVPTYQSAWLKAHHPAAFLAGVLTHDPGMYPKRLILDDARQFGLTVLPLDVNRSDSGYRVEKLSVYDEPPPGILDQPPRPAAGYGIRLGLADVRGITDAEVARILAGRPFATLSDFWHRAAVSRPVVERLVVAGAFDAIYGLDSTIPLRRRGRVTRRDLLLQAAELASQPPGRRRSGFATKPPADRGSDDVRERAKSQSQAAKPVGAVDVQLAFDLEEIGSAPAAGLPEMTLLDRVQAELDVLGLDATAHVLAGYEPFLAALGVTRARDLLGCRSQAEVLVAGVKVATQTPPVRSGRRVVFVTLDDATGPVDATFFEDAQAGHAATLFHSWLLVIRGLVRRTGPRGISLNALACWELTGLRAAWESGGMVAVDELMRRPGVLTEETREAAVHGAAGSRSTRPVMTGVPVRSFASGFQLSPYADIRPAGPGIGRGRGTPPRKLWHASPGSSGP
jgi:error-prone DNA polymerase